MDSHLTLHRLIGTPCATTTTSTTLARNRHNVRGRGDAGVVQVVQVPAGALAHDVGVVRGGADRDGARGAAVHVAQALRDLLERVLLVAAADNGCYRLLPRALSPEDLVM